MIYPTYALIHRLLEKNDGLSANQICQEMRMTYSGVKSALQRMEILGLIDREPNAGPTPPRGGDAPHLWRAKK